MSGLIPGSGFESGLPPFAPGTAQGLGLPDLQPGQFETGGGAAPASGFLSGTSVPNAIGNMDVGLGSSVAAAAPSGSAAPWGTSGWSQVFLNIGVGAFGFMLVFVALSGMAINNIMGRLVK